MKVVGLTGGIGSGKTTVAKMFSNLGVPIYIADVEAKRLMNTSKVIKRKLIALLGDEAYNKDGLNRVFVASKVFNNENLLAQINAIVHPKVGAHFKRWLKKQKTAYVIKEAAIIFEHNKEAEYDFLITVVADKEERIKRILNRDATTKEKVKAIMEHQLDDEEKVKRSDFVIVNNTLQETEAQVLKLNNLILKTIH